MKTKKGWYILLVVWILLLAAEILSYIGVYWRVAVRGGTQRVPAAQCGGDRDLCFEYPR